MTKCDVDSAVIEWLLAGDPAIRWQTMRDVLGQSARKWKAERALVASDGWGKQLLDARDPQGTWGGGIYQPKWTSTTYTLLLLRDIGVARNHPACQAGATLIVDHELGALAGRDFARRLKRLDLCVTGMDLSLLSYFDTRKDDRIEALLEYLLAEQMDDGGWNCKRVQHRSTHGSLHTTVNVLDGLLDYLEYRPSQADCAIRSSIARAQEFMLQHRLFRSDKTGEIIDEAFRLFSYPPRWHFDVLRGLDHFRRAAAPGDKRLAEAIELLIAKRKPDGRWPLQNVHRGQAFFQMEKQGQPSRWNTLRALRILRWWDKADK